jgi:hypothetical protein
VRPIDGRRRDSDGLPLHQSYAPARDGVPADACHDPFSRHHLKLLRGADGEAPGLGRRQDRGGDRMLGIPLDSSRAGEQLALTEAVKAEHVRNLWGPEGHRPGLVHDHGVHPGQGLEPAAPP